MNDHQEKLIGTETVQLTDGDFRKIGSIVESTLHAGAHIAIWAVGDRFRCEVFDESRHLLFRVDSKSWPEALAATTKGFMENLKEIQT